MVRVRLMTLEDYDAVYALWAALPGLGLHEPEDSREGVARYLRRNPSTCFAAEEDGEILGAVLCGTESRRGSIHHTAVARAHQGRGIGRALIDACAAALRELGCPKASVLVYRGNDDGQAFWQALGFVRRPQLEYWTLDL